MLHHDTIHGCLLGTAVGDAIGLAREGLGRRRALRMFGAPPLHHSLIRRRGMLSDDTEHTVIVGQALIASGGDTDAFTEDLARRLRWWLLRLPAGVGLGTLRSCVKLWLGFAPPRSAVASAGNGPAMRSALLGVMAPNLETAAEWTHAATLVTHSDPRAEQGAQLVAAAAHGIVRHRSDPLSSVEVLDAIRSLATAPDLREVVEAMTPALEAGLNPAEFAESVGQGSGITGFTNHTVPAALYCWLAHRGSFRKAVEAAVCLGGDSDTVAAITGALAGAECGVAGIPNEWVDGLVDWPCTTEWLDSLASALADQRERAHACRPPRLSAAALLARNAVFTLIVLAHGVRRLLPPY